MFHAVIFNMLLIFEALHVFTYKIGVTFHSYQECRFRSPCFLSSICPSCLGRFYLDGFGVRFFTTLQLTFQMITRKLCSLKNWFFHYFSFYIRYGIEFKNSVIFNCLLKENVLQTFVSFSCTYFSEDTDFQ